IKIKSEEIYQALDYKNFVQTHYKLEKITTFLMSDRYDMDPIVRTTANSLEKSGDLFIRSYSDLLRDAKKFNQEFINKYEEIKEVYDN
ncbi:ATP-binding protein, partial [Enterococcus faecalis]|nr:ATP-binding protein [Enterococcus faecalis]